MVKNSQLQVIIKIMIGSVLLLSALWGYLPIPKHMNEYTFLSNMIEGIVLVYSGILLSIKRKHIPTIIDLCMVILALIMLGICITNYKIFGFTGAFLFLHIINPLLLLFHWIFVTEKGKINNAKLILTVLILPVMYMIYLFIFGFYTDNYIYPIFDINALGLINVIISILLIGVFFLGIAYILYVIDKKAAKVKIKGLSKN